MAIPYLIDVHAHICDPDFDDDRTDVLMRARKAGVAAIVAVGENLADARKNVTLAGAYPMIKPAAGLYPAILDSDQADDMLDFIRLNRARLAAIGEVGLDYWLVKEDTQRERQRTILTRFIELSKSLNLPLNVHSRSAGHYAIALLLENNATRVQMHAFDGKASAALNGGRGGILFFNSPLGHPLPPETKTGQTTALYACLLVETDSPVLGPVAQTRNEPANLSVSIEAIAQIKDIPEEAVIEAVAENTQRLYGDLRALV
jgi:TatD DNase family protein